jgi:hypothetical protein
VHHLDFAAAVQQFMGKMRRTACTRGGIGHLAWPALRKREQIFDVFHRHRRVDQQDHRHHTSQCDRGEVFQRVVSHFLE